MQRERLQLRLALPVASASWCALPLLLAVAVWVSPSLAAGPQAGAAKSSPGSTREEGVRWQSLSPTQREALAPLEHDWPSIDAQRKQKWIALAARFHTLSGEERARITARMVEWAKLTPAERGQARLRFEEARQLPAPDRSARWQAYQALPPEQRAQLAARAASASSAAADQRGRAAKPLLKDTAEPKSNIVPGPSTAQAPRPVAPTLVQAAPGATTTLITRRPTPPAHQQSGMPKIAATPEFVERSTLLPKRGPQAAAITAAGASAPAMARMPTLAPASAASVGRPLPAVAATPSSSATR